MVETYTLKIDHESIMAGELGTMLEMTLAGETYGEEKVMYAFISRGNRRCVRADEIEGMLGSTWRFLEMQVGWKGKNPPLEIIFWPPRELEFTRAFARTHARTHARAFAETTSSS